MLARTQAALAATEAALAERTARLAEVEAARRRLQLIVDELRRGKFGASSEKLSPPTSTTCRARTWRSRRACWRPPRSGPTRRCQRRAPSPAPSTATAAGRLPTHLPRVERVIEPASTLCPCGCGPMARIGEDVAARRDVVPAQFRVPSAVY